VVRKNHVSIITVIEQRIRATTVREWIQHGIVQPQCQSRTDVNLFLITSHAMLQMDSRLCGNDTLAVNNAVLYPLPNGRGSDKSKRWSWFGYIAQECG